MKKGWGILLFLLISIFVVPQTYALSSCATTFTDLNTSDSSLMAATGCLNQNYCVVRGNQGVLSAGTQISRQEAIALIARYHVEVLHDWPLSTNGTSYWTDFPNTDSTLFFPVQTAREQGFIQGYDNGDGTKSLDPTALWLFGFHGITKTDSYNGTTYNFQAPGAAITRGEFMKDLYDYGNQRNQLSACHVYQCGNQCSTFYGCAMTGNFQSSTSDCKTPIQDPPYTTNQACGYQGKGDDSRCVATAHNPIGYFDAADANGLKGWACDLDDLNAALHVDFYVDGPAGQGTQIDGAFTTVDRPDTGTMCKDAAGNPTTKHGFLLPLSSIPAQFKDGKNHQIYAYALNVGGGTTNPQLNLSPRTFTYQTITNCPARCSNSLGCTRVEAFQVSNGDCTNSPAVVGNLTYTKVDPSVCGPQNGAFGGNDNNCPVPTGTPVPPTPTPSDWTTCSALPATNGSSTLIYSPLTTGTYKVWARMMAGSSTANTFYLQVGDQCQLIVGGSNISTSTWQWTNQTSSGAPISVNLVAGRNYSVQLVGIASGVKVDEVKFDNTGCAMLEGADGHCASTVTPTTATGKLTASPNPCTIPAGQNDCSTTVSWTTQNATNVTLSPGGSVSTSGSTPAIVTANGATYTLSSNGVVLDTIKLTAVNAPTTAPNSTLLNMHIILHAIGIGGDNANPNGGGGNPAPIHPQRNLNVKIYDTQNKLVLDKTGPITFLPSTDATNTSSLHGGFNGQIDLGTNIPTGDYTVLIKTDSYLAKRYSTLVHIVNATTNDTPTITLVTGDIDGNNKLTIMDYKILSDCYGDFTTPDPAKCSAAQKNAADLNDDGNVNQFDLNYFIRELSVQSGGDEPGTSQ